MAYELGKDWRIYVGDGGGTEVFDALGGEGSFEFQRQATEIDLSTKDDSDYAVGDFGLMKITITVSGNVKLPDTSIERLLDKAKDATDKKTNIQIKDGSIVKFAGEVAVGGNGITASKDGAVVYSFTLIASAAPTTDDMAATT